KWSLIVIAQCECLPSPTNRVTLDPTARDHWDMPVLRMDVAFGPNEIAMRKEAGDTCVAMLKEAGYQGVNRIPTTPIPGATIHEMGGAPMGQDRKTSILDKHNRCHDVPNLYVTDGAAMCSSSSANPSLTYMALTARAAAYAADQFKRGQA
ncbi:MAG TPA: GMC family oxidoreductase, partial [Candidatus Binataceae bacterium]|nr:GMC family oxidoreductase [Candidatus Binataceae bacterium]